MLARLPGLLKHRERLPSSPEVPFRRCDLRGSNRLRGNVGEPLRDVVSKSVKVFSGTHARVLARGQHLRTLKVDQP